MCADREPRPSLRASWRNLRHADNPALAARLFLRNNWIKIRTRSNCCGNNGEPGC